MTIKNIEHGRVGGRCRWRARKMRSFAACSCGPGRTRLLGHNGNIYYTQGVTSCTGVVFLRFDLWPQCSFGRPARRVASDGAGNGQTNVFVSIRHDVVSYSRDRVGSGPAAPDAAGSRTRGRTGRNSFQNSICTTATLTFLSA